MAVLPITKYGTPVLRKKLADVTVFDDNLKKIVDDMFETMYEVRGIGLAANQVGLDQRIIVLDGSAHYEGCEKIALVNPDIIEMKGEEWMVEGCLSIPGLEGDVARATEIIVKAQDLDGKDVLIQATDMQARIFQHECDHINGKMYVDRVTPSARTLMESKLKKLQKQTEQSL